MEEIALARINSFGKSPETDFAQRDDTLSLEIPILELQNILTDITQVYNQLAEMVRDAGILRGRELAKITQDHNQSLQAEKSPTGKILLLNAYTKQLIARVSDAMKTKPGTVGTVVQVATKVMSRAIRLVDHVMATVGNDPRKTVALDSQQARLLFSGGGETVSRKETIRAMKRAEKLCPALTCDHRPNDGRQTMRLTATVEDLKETHIQETDNRNRWQRLNTSIGLNNHDRDPWGRSGENTDLPRNYFDVLTSAVAVKGIDIKSSMKSRDVHL